MRSNWYKDCSTTKKEKKSSASFFATSEILVPKISFCYCFTKLGKPLFYFGPAFFLLVSSGMLWLIPGKKEPFGHQPFHIRSFASKMQMLPLTYLIYAMGSKPFWIRILILINLTIWCIESADFLHHNRYANAKILWSHDATNRKQD